MLKITRCQKCLDALNDNTRIKILDSLAKKSPQTVNEVVSHFKLRQPTISHHLKILRQYGFVSSQKAGNQIHYSFASHCQHNKSCYLLQKI